MKKLVQGILGLIPYVLAGIFLWAGISKLGGLAGFAQAVEDFQFFPDWTVNMIAMTVPVLEIATAGLLLNARLRRRGALVSSGLSLAFCVLFAWAIMRGLSVDCGCFGGSGETGGVSSVWGFVRAAMVLGLSLVCFWRSAAKDSQESACHGGCGTREASRPQSF